MTDEQARELLLRHIGRSPFIELAIPAIQEATEEKDTQLKKAVEAFQDIGIILASGTKSEIQKTEQIIIVIADIFKELGVE